jgi:putative phosphoesterase
MRIGVLSDTHGHVANTQDAVRMLESLQVTKLIHCGDIGSSEIVQLLSPWPTHYVLGNVDYDPRPLEEAMEAVGHRLHGRFGELTISGNKVAFLHGDDMRRLRESTESQKWDLICCGHTHVASQQIVGRTLILNPGAVYRAAQHSVAIVDFPSREVTSVPF